MNNIVIKGYYGRDNLGDELMMEIFIKTLKGYSENIDIKIMNSSPENTKDLYNIETPYELVTGKKPSLKVLLKRIKTIISSDLYVLGGGTILTDKHSYLHFLENITYFALRKLLGKESQIISVGSTNFRTEIGKILCSILVRLSSVCAVRDIKSYNQLIRISPKKKLKLTADMVLLAEDIYDMKNNSKSTKGIKKVGICVMPYYSATFKQPEKDEFLADSLASLAINLKENLGLDVYFIPIQSGSGSDLDLVFSKTVNKKCNHKFPILDSNLSSDKINSLNEMDLVISMRLHALMLSALMGKKIIAINHNEKINAFMEQYNLKDFMVDLDNIANIQKLVQKVKQDDLAFKIDQSEIESQKEKAKNNIEIIKGGLVI